MKHMRKLFVIFLLSVVHVGALVDGGWEVFDLDFESLLDILKNLVILLL